MEQSVDSKDIFLKRWSWGGFLVSPIWALGSRKYVAGILLLLACIIPIIPFGFGIYYGIKGRQLSWEKGGWSSFEEFAKRQRLLDNVCFALFLVSLVLYFVVG